jgi:nucleoside-diphosphate-sugar epimerase
MKRVLIAGSGGFVGSVLVDKLVAAGHDVTVMTTSDRGPPAIRRLKLQQWHPETVGQAELSPRYDLIFNLAAYGVDPSQNNATESRLANAELPLAFVALAERAGAQALIHAGTAFEYAGSAECRPLHEADPVEVHKHYGANKATGSRGVIELSRERQLNAVVARLFAVYGPGERSWRLLPSLCTSLGRGRAVALTEGSQIRDFLFVDDAAGGLIALAEAVATGRQCSTIVNLCSGVETTVRHFAETVADAAGASRDLLHFGAIPMRPHEIAYLVGDVTLLHRMTSWRPAYSLERGIAKAVAELSARNRGAS